MSVRAVVVTGPIGVGKTTVAQQLGHLLAAQDEPHAVIDMDGLRDAWPSPADDRFHTRLGYRNLADVARNFREAGVRHFVLADIVEYREQRERYRDAIPGAEVVVVLLAADLNRIRERIDRRAGGDADPWEVERSAELTEMMDANAVADLTIDTTDRSPREVAEEILRRLKWDTAREI